MSENPSEQSNESLNEEAHEQRVKRFRGDILDLPAEDRMVRLEPLFMGEVTLEHEGAQIPQLKGMGFHMHSKAVVVDENGVEESWQCDYVALDTAQMVALRDALNRLLYVEGE